MPPDPATFDRLAVPYDRGMALLEWLWLRSLRARLLPHVRGRVLEIGIGTGANLPFYPPSVCLMALDESAEMLVVAGRRALALGRCVYFSQGDAERLAFPTGSFDTVVGSLVLCSVVNLGCALEELRRVLRAPGGRLLLLEHTRPRPGPLAWLADRANGPWYAFNGRCHLNRDTEGAVIEAGFQVLHVERRLGGLLRLMVAEAA